MGVKNSTCPDSSERTSQMLQVAVYKVDHCPFYVTKDTKYTKTPESLNVAQEAMRKIHFIQRIKTTVLNLHNNPIFTSFNASRRG